MDKVFRIISTRWRG